MKLFEITNAFSKGIQQGRLVGKTVNGIMVVDFIHNDEANVYDFLYKLKGDTPVPLLVNGKLYLSKHPLDDIYHWHMSVVRHRNSQRDLIIFANLNGYARMPARHFREDLRDYILGHFGTYTHTTKPDNLFNSYNDFTNIISNKFEEVLSQFNALREI